MLLMVVFIEAASYLRAMDESGRSECAGTGSSDESHKSRRRSDFRLVPAASQWRLLQVDSDEQGSCRQTF
jgi:hypothetical protein